MFTFLYLYVLAPATQLPVTRRSLPSTSGPAVRFTTLVLSGSPHVTNVLPSCANAHCDETRDATLSANAQRALPYRFMVSRCDDGGPRRSTRACSGSARARQKVSLRCASVKRFVRCTTTDRFDRARN